MDELLLNLLLESLVSAGWIERDGKSLTMRRPTQAAAPHLAGRWLDESIALLLSSGLLTRLGVETFCSPRDPDDLRQLWQRWDAEKNGRRVGAGNHHGEISLAEACLRALPDILCGRRLPMEIMFPDSSTELVNTIYTDNRVFDHANSALADALSILIQERRRLGSVGTLRVLEVGAGTGATTAAVLAKLELTGQSLKEYRFTDVSRLFLANAEHRLTAPASFLQTQLLDIEAPPVEQGLRLATYDFVVAANVVHATTHVRVSLRNIKTLLKHNGILLLNELSAKSLLHHLTFGLLEGWWRYEDDALRIPGSPLLEPDVWVRVLEEEGFRRIARPMAPNQDLGQQLFVAESDGFVRLASKVTPPSKRAGERAVAPRATASSVRQPESIQGRVADMPQAEPNASRASDDDHCIELLRQIVADAIRLPRGDVLDHVGFFEYGVDSLIAVRLVNRINRALGVSLRANTLFEHGSVVKLARYICELRENSAGSLAATRQRR